MPLVEGGGAAGKGGGAGDRLEQIGVVARRPSEVFAPKLEPRLAREPPGPVAEPAGIGGTALVERGVDHGARNLGIVRPRAPVEIVGAGDQEHVVDDANLAWT